MPVSLNKAKCPLLGFAVAATVMVACEIQSLLSKDAPVEAGSDDLAAGKRAFENHCARCHGILGTGGFGPSLARAKLRNAPDQDALMGVISSGIPGTAMPGAWQLAPKDTKFVAAYVWSLGQVIKTPVPGDPIQGKSIYDGKGECAKCHSIRRQGGVQGPDLTDIGGLRGPEYLRRALVDPGAELPEEMTDNFAYVGYAQFLPVKIVMLDGREIDGVRLNEDAFTIQLHDPNNRVYSFRKTEVKEVRKQFGQSIMPSLASALTAAELDDLVAYLVTLRGDE